MSSPSIDRGPFSFFWLPAEIQCLVYRHLLYAQGDVINRERLSPNRDHIDPFYQITPVYTAILETCWTIYREAIDILYGDNTLCWNSVHQSDISHVMPTLLGDIKTENLHKNVQLKVSFVSLSKPFTDRDNFLLRPTGPTIPREVFEVYVGMEGALGNRITQKLEVPGHPGHLTSPVIQVIKNLTSFKKVVVRLSPRPTGFHEPRRRGRPTEYV